MKSEKEIRSHLNDLIAARKIACGCAGTAHEWQCVVGGKMMGAVIGTLQWLLGENEELQEMVDSVHQDMLERSHQGN